MNGEQRVNYREHCQMMLDAMGCKRNTRFMTNEQIRDLIEEEKITFLRKLQREIDKENQCSMAQN